MNRKRPVPPKETLEEFLARGGKVKKKIISDEYRKKYRASLRSDSRYSFKDSRPPEEEA